MMQARTRSVDFRMSESDGQTLEGYAAVFDSPTVINSWEGHFVETIERGAFARSVRNNPKPVMQFDHGTHGMVGGIPIASIEELREDDQGLFVRARLHDNWLVEPVRDAIRSGALQGMSFKFTIPEGGETVSRGEGDEMDLHTLTDVNLHELGPVVWPAYADTSVGVRSSELVELLTADDELRKDLANALVYSEPVGEATDERSDTETSGEFTLPDEDTFTDLAVGSDDQSDTDVSDETSEQVPVRADEDSEVPTVEDIDPVDSVRPDEEAAPTVTRSETTRQHDIRQAELVAARMSLILKSESRKENS